MKVSQILTFFNYMYVLLKRNVYHLCYNFRLLNRKLLAFAYRCISVYYYCNNSCSECSSSTTIATYPVNTRKSPIYVIELDPILRGVVIKHWLDRLLNDVNCKHKMLNFYFLFGST